MDNDLPQLPMHALSEPPGFCYYSQSQMHSYAIAAQAPLIERIKELEKTVKEVLGCFEAAEIEGLFQALDETTDERLRDLVLRRLMYAQAAALAASQGQQKGGV